MGKKLTVFVDGHSFDTKWQGTTSFLQGILNAMPAAMQKVAPDVDLRLFCSAEREANIRPHITTPFEFVPVRPGFLRRNTVDIPRALRAIGANLVISQYVRPFFAPCPTLSVIHDVLFLDLPNSFSWKYRTARRLLFGWSARHSTFVSTVSHYSAKRIEAHFGIPANAIQVIPNAVNPAFLAAADQPRSPPPPLRLISVSRLEKRKRHEWGIAAQEALAGKGIDSEFQIIGAGGGDYAEGLLAELAAARQRGIKVENRSDLPLTDLVEAYSQSSFFIFPAEAEGFGIPVIEAAAAGLPGVISDGGALAEFKGQIAGEFFAAGDKAAFIAAVLRVAKNLPGYREKAHALRPQVGQAYSWDFAAERYGEIFRTVAGIQR